eukprot:scaffold84624_cov24-Cyclotella_meneghiniana.AAC.1
MEFEPVGERVEHIVAGGKANVGKVTEKQTWKHKHSDYEFQWHIPPGKKAFDRSRMWKAARRVVKLNKHGAVRLSCILRLAKKEIDVTTVSREEDMVKRVNAVMAIISSKVALSVLNDEYFVLYAKSLDPKHKIPHHLEVQRITEVMIDVGMTEVTKIVADRRKVLSQDFASLTTDFVTDSNRHESYGVILMELVAEWYELEDGRVLAMSRETAERIANLLLTLSPKLANLEYPLIFERFLLPKTIENVVEWMQCSTKCAKARASDISQ